jgi:hypothetical protein
VCFFSSNHNLVWQLHILIHSETGCLFLRLFSAYSTLLIAGL